MGCLVSAEVECIQCSLFKKVIKPPLNITQLYQCNFWHEIWQDSYKRTTKNLPQRRFEPGLLDDKTVL